MFQRLLKYSCQTVSNSAGKPTLQGLELRISEIPEDVGIGTVDHHRQQGQSEDTKKNTRLTRADLCHVPRKGYPRNANHRSRGFIQRENIFMRQPRIVGDPKRSCLSRLGKENRQYECGCDYGYEWSQGAVTNG